MPAETILGQIAVQGFSGLLSNLATSYVKRGDRKLTQDSETIKTDLSDHLEITFKKCTKVKTILNGDETSETLAIYVDQTFNVQGDTLDQYGMVDFIRNQNSAVIIGAGGGGKSMFMRYLWLSFFEKADGHIPFFLELRNLNNLSHESIEDFIFHSIVKSGSKIKQSDFQSSIKNGEFILFLDGFDEINFDRREKMQHLILELQENNPKLTIVVTSRADERFLGWGNFTTAYVKSLSKENSKLLIERADYSSELKSKFLSKFDELFELHDDFLSNPLLAYMMLVTFSYNPDIPKKMFQFYEQAFEALYHRHDLTKGYKRKFHCKIDKMEFIKLTAFICLKTYYDEEFEFSKTGLLEVIEEAKTAKIIETIEFKSEDFLEDLIQSVCLIKMEGLTYTFTHRSFQEYFAAYCISRVAIRDVDPLFSKFAKRHGDSVLPMVAEINTDLFREKYILPNARKFQSFIQRKSERNLYESFASRAGAKFHIGIIKPSVRKSKKQKVRGNKGNIQGISLNYSGDMAEFFQVIRSIADSKEIEINVDVDGLGHRNSDLAFQKFLHNYIADDCNRVWIVVIENKIVVTSHLDVNKNTITHNDQEIIVEEFKKTRMYSFIVETSKLFISFVRAEVSNYDHVTKAFKDFF